jgi:hypothetical protein
MRQYLRNRYANLITSCGHLLILLVALHINDPQAWVAAFALIALISFFAWASTFRRSRAIADTPTSKIGSAAQGYVEILGRASNAPESLAPAKMGSLPCVWFRCITYRRTSDNKWQEIGRETSDSVFEISDETGRCMIDPDDAEVLTTHRRTWYEGQYKHVEEQLFPGDNIYVLGEFSTIGGANGALDLNADMSVLLEQWKKDRPTLLKRFDLDGNGEVDLKEWQLARNAARREIEKQHRELRLHTGVHVMRNPAGGQLYLLSNLSPHQLKLRYALWSWFHIIMFFGGVGGAVWGMMHIALSG